MVKLYKGCYGKRRDGKIVGPAIYVPNRIDSKKYNLDGLFYTDDGYVWKDKQQSHGDILEVYPSDLRENNSLELAAEQKTEKSEWEVEDNIPPFNLSSREQWRWWFAGQAIQGIISSNANDWRDENGKQVNMTGALASAIAAKYSNALVEQLEKGKEDV